MKASSISKFKSESPTRGSTSRPPTSNWTYGVSCLWYPTCFFFIFWDRCSWYRKSFIYICLSISKVMSWDCICWCFWIGLRGGMEKLVARVAKTVGKCLLKEYGGRFWNCLPTWLLWLFCISWRHPMGYSKHTRWSASRNKSFEFLKKLVF